MSTCFSHRKTYSVTDAASVYANNCISRFEKVDIDCIANAMHGFAKRYVVKSVMKMYVLAMFFCTGEIFQYSGTLMINLYSTSFIPWL